MKITSKGQVTIPEAMRRKYGFLPDTEVSFVSGKGGLMLKKGKSMVRSDKSRGQKMVERLRGSATSEFRTWTTDEIMKFLRS